MIMQNFNEIRRQHLINKANKLLDRADLLVARIISNAQIAETQKSMLTEKSI